LLELAPGGLAVVLAAPGLLGVGGHLAPTDLPTDWEQVRQAVTAAPGTVVSLPWHEYATYDLGGPREIFDPWPAYLGGDVIICSDPERQTTCGTPGSVGERADRREPVVGELVGGARAGQPVGDRLAALGVRWVVLAHVADWESFGGLAADAGLERVVAGPTVDLFRVRGWRGDVVDDAGRPVEFDPVVEPWARVGSSSAAVWSRAGSAGWRRGTAAATQTADGRLALPAGSGPVWYWPVLLVGLGDVVWLAVMVVSTVSFSNRRRPRRRGARPPRPARRP
jgi:hypothetical protein